MTVNNVCSYLIVFGSYAPGGENHSVFSKLPGTWKKGKILCSMMDPPDGIGPGEHNEVEAWTIEFSDCRAEIFTPEWETQRRLLHNRWTELDSKMGPEWARDSTRWWPEHCDPVVGQNGMIVVNIYVPLQYFPYLKDREDVPSPDEEADIFGMWTAVKTRRKRYDWSCFLGLIKDATPDQYEELFGDLTHGVEFIRKLRRFYQEHQKGSGNLLWDGKSEYSSLYVCPLAKNALGKDALMSLVRADFANRAKLLRTMGHEVEAESLETLTFAFGKPQIARPDESSSAAALCDVGDMIAESNVVSEHWFYCLEEACYGIAASYDLARWLMSQWYSVDFDFEPAYGFWKGGGVYEIVGDTCHVYRIDSES